jgi:PhnB protein
MASTPKPQPIPERYRRVTPALVVDGAAKALEFYAEVFGATERMRVPGPGGTIAHAEIEIGFCAIRAARRSRHQSALGHRPPDPVRGALL